jgi:hypothetical protein
MLTFNAILKNFDWCDIGPSYDDESVMVYSGDLWALAKAFSGNGTDTKTLNRITDIAENYGVELRFYDETITDYQGRVHNTNPTSWGWIPTYKFFDCEVWAQDEARDDVETYADLLVNDDSNADQWGIDFSELGFIRYEGQGESGWYPGQNDTPQSMRQSIEAKYGACEIIWTIDDTGQFDMRFGAWFRKVEG